jgi:hypothetical protein
MTALFWLSDAPILLAALAGAVFYIVGKHHDTHA